MRLEEGLVEKRKTIHGSGKGQEKELGRDK